MAIPLSDMILLAVSFAGFGILTWTLYKLIPPKPKPRQVPNNDENNRAARRRRHRIEQRNNNRRRAIAAVAAANEDDIDDHEEDDDDDPQNVNDNESEEENEDGEINIKNLSRKERMKAQKRAEREERRRYEEQRREELRQKKEEEEAEYLERRERVYEEMERERLEEERKLNEKLTKEKNDYNYWSKMFTVVDAPPNDYNYELEMKKMKQRLLEYIIKNQIIDFDTISDEFGTTMTSKELKGLVKEMMEEDDIFGVFDERNRFVHFSNEELFKLADFIENFDGRISVSNLLHEIENVSNCRISA